MHAAATMAELMLASCRRHADLPAVQDGSRCLSYREVLDCASRFAGALRSHGLAARDRVAVVAEDRVEAVTAYLGVWLAGCTVVHVNARLAAAEVQYLVDDSQANAIIHTAGLQSLVDQLAPGDRVRLVMALEGGAGAAHVPLRSDSPARAAPGEVSSADIAIIGYTSGTSGRPKGAVVSHRSLVLSCRVAPYSLHMPKRSRLAYTGSVSFVGSFWGQVWPHLYLGGMVHFLGHYDLDSWFAAMRADRSTFTFLPTPLMTEFAEGLRQEPRVLEHLETIMHAGSLAPIDHVAAVVEASQARYVETYGSTEIVGSVTATSPAMYRSRCDAQDLLASAGTVLPSAEVWIQRPDGTPAEPGEEGPIHVRSDTLFHGYWNDQQRTAEVLTPDGAFDTGDIGTMDNAGFLYIRGRHSELIISGGMNVYPAEVERAILTHPDVLQVAVVGIPHSRWGEGVAAAVVARPGSVLDDAAVITVCREQLASYKKPTAVLFLDALPQNPSRKIDKRALRNLFESSRVAGTRPDA